ncbi:MAG TPA: BTAD domain-containing putative transcriptional regulator [Actinospica sp.]|nr:BTAD domain-containing putative transcriptional regulator [Actinospica sp.]
MRGDVRETLRFEVLGPMRVADGERSRPVSGARQRILLGVLLERANQPVSTGKLVELVWDGAPPDGGLPTLRTYLVRLRRGLGPRVAARILTRDNGYMAQVEEHELDALLFEAQCRRMDAAVRVGDWSGVSEAAESALAVWRGAPLVDVPSRFLHETWLPRLEQSRLQVLEWQAEAALRLGRSEQLIQPLRELTTAHPLRERFHAQFMLALYRAGRQAEALAAYQDARHILVENLGIEPGAELRSLHSRILSGEVEPAPVRPLVEEKPAMPQSARKPPSPVARVAPQQLPASAQHFTGRQIEMDLLVDRLGPLTQQADSGGAIVISAIDGMAGIGKTALAVRAAHHLAERFPDGQLFLDLHGYTQGRRPSTPEEALDVLLLALGTPAQQIPRRLEERAALYRQQLYDTRTLIVLDNASDEAQVRPLLPGESGCLVLVTSRRRLKGLDDAHTLPLDLLPSSDAVALLRAVAGANRFPPHDPLASEVVDLCGRLPLAVRIAGALLRHRPAWTLEYLAELLRDRHRRVPNLYDGERDLATAFGLSYTSLDEHQQDLFRALGLVPGPDIDAYAAAALRKSDPAIVSRRLGDLVDHNLLTEYAPGRYRLHDLLRAHARTLVDADPAPESDAAVGRLLHYYAYTAHSASVAITRCPRSEPDGPIPAHTPALADPEAARTWLRTEYSNLEAAFVHAHAHGLDRHAIALSTGLAEIVLADGPFTHALQIHRTAAGIAERLGDRAVHADALTDLGRARSVTGDFPGAVDTYTRALELYRALGDRLGEANVLTHLGGVRPVTGDFSGAVDAYTRALELYRALDSRYGEANALTELGRVRYITGDYPGADTAHTRALELYRALGNSLGEAYALANLGRLRQATGDLPGASGAHTRALELYHALGNRLGEANVLTYLGRVRHLTEDYPGAGAAHARALELYRALGNRLGEAYALTELGRARHMAGDYPGADTAHTRALEIHRALGHRSNESWALNHYAATLAATGRRSRALAVYEQALAMNRELNKPDDEALALEGLGDCHLSAGDTETGVSRLRAALEIYRRLGMISAAGRVRARLADLARSAPGEAASQTTELQNG